MTMLEVSGISAGYGKIIVVRDLTFSVPTAGFTAVLGRNGAGKTTAIKAVCGLLPVVAGTVTLDGERLSGLAAHKIVRSGVGYVPQGRELFPGLSVIDNLELGAFTVRDPRKVEAALDTVFDAFPALADKRKRTVGSLSGGEQQMVAVGRALMVDPKIMILDEPSAGLAPKVLQAVFETVDRIRRERGTTVLVAEQNARQVMKYADHVYVIESGAVVGSGTTAEIAADASLMESYLGEKVK
jgi:branched-chain amino acid transport system ATP-binding protein